MGDRLVSAAPQHWVAWLIAGIRTLEIEQEGVHQGQQGQATRLEEMPVRAEDCDGAVVARRHGE